MTEMLECPKILLIYIEGFYTSKSMYISIISVLYCVLVLPGSDDRYGRHFFPIKSFLRASVLV